MFPDFHFAIPHKDHISSNKRPQHLSTYLRKRRVIHMKFEKFVIVSFQITANNNHYDIVLYIPKLLVVCLASTFAYLLHMHFTLVTVRLWSGF